ncbi:hypothetical protein AF332_06945 [Sporosarcina globispora]|uniref:IrrE N-terminal-like domain-containing protein n=1 Tax=Sporosarcina globispora TaxID=1459 RepID=A0A0M0GAX3_SPOGL|nr:ImmA/IrrE family metallo-endopeptidase [Sporosarcina globispora]KON86581.1 hypothetical protein AF332_06945 [Sporosarcina globispora]
MTWVKKVVEGLINQYGTNNPYEIAAAKKIYVFEKDLHPEILGFYKYIRRNQFIYINSNLENFLKLFTVSHELGHSELHPRVNTPFLRANTFFSVDKIEVQANTFAVELLIPDSVIHKNYHSSIYELAAMQGVPQEMVHLKKF